MFKFYGTKIIMMNDLVSNRLYDQELTNDLLETINYFSKKDFVHTNFMNKMKKELLSECQ